VPKSLTTPLYPPPQKRLAARAQNHHSAKTVDELSEDLHKRFEGADVRRMEAQAGVTAKAKEEGEKAAAAKQAKAKIVSEGGGAAHDTEGKA
jgi:hypothetical protein